MVQKSELFISWFQTWHKTLESFHDITIWRGKYIKTSINSNTITHKIHLMRKYLFSHLAKEKTENTWLTTFSGRVRYWNINLAFKTKKKHHQKHFLWIWNLPQGIKALLMMMIRKPAGLEIWNWILTIIHLDFILKKSLTLEIIMEWYFC